MKRVEVRDATHVKVEGKIERIVSKWGIDGRGRLSEQGFGVVTESGRHVDMWKAQSYFREEKSK